LENDWYFGERLFGLESVEGDGVDDDKSSPEVADTLGTDPLSVTFPSKRAYLERSNLALLLETRRVDLL